VPGIAPKFNFVYTALRPMGFIDKFFPKKVKHMHHYCKYKCRLVKLHTVSSSVGTEGTLAPARAAYVAGIVLACCSLCGCRLSC
jgi:hypothetical protein